MRDPKRIKKILKLIEQHWVKNESMRFGQLLINLGIADDSNRVWQRDDWDLEDDLIKDLKKENAI